MIGADFINEATFELKIEEVIQPEIIAPDTISFNTDFQVLVNQGNWSEYQIGNYYIDYGDSTITKNDTTPHHYKHTGFKELKVLISGYDKISNEIMTKCFYKTIFVTPHEAIMSSGKRFLEGLKYAGFNTDEIEEIEDGIYMLEILTTKKSVLGDSIILKEFVNQAKEVYDTNTRLFSYTIGQTKKPFELIDNFRLAHKNGFIEAIVKSYHDGKMKIEDLGLAFEEESGEVNIVLNNIQFEYDGHLLDKESKIELEKLTQYLNDHQEIRIEIGAHTDASRNIKKAKQVFLSRGQKYSKSAHDKMSGNYNLKLSQRRAKSVANYLSTKGINIIRLKPKGYGETQPLAPNNNIDGTDNPEGRTKNRRVSFKILSN
ncbi:OmpA family protein [Vicingaceae bacterium]|nr:OmpA family protein [Vicingaceae bacterium]